MYYTFDVLFLILVVIALFSVTQKSNNQVTILGFESFNKVNNLPNKEQSAKLLEEIKHRLQKLIKYCNLTAKSNEEKKEISPLNKRFEPDNIREADIYDSGTSFTLDKGKEVHLCLRNKDTLQHHDINTLMFVAIHELAHVMSISYGHNGEFAENFTYLLKKASEARLYNPVDYRTNNKHFCGIVIDSSPLFP